ncbi:hypothetical protein ACFLZX_02675, partial [Nanoarchaeota archaeon]
KMAKSDEAEELFKHFASEPEKKKKKKQKDIVETRTVEKGVKNKEEVKEIVFRYKPILIERIIYVTIIIILIMILLFKSFSGCPFSCSDEKVVKVVVENDTDESDDEPQNEPQDEPDDEPDEPQDEPQDEPDDEPDNSPKGGGPITLTIDDVEFETDDHGNPLKITSIDYIIDNNKEDLKPTLKVYFYDKDSDAELTALVRTSFTFSIPIRVGQKITGTLKTFDSYYFDKSNKAETIKVELVDSADGDELDTQTKIIGN